MKVERALAVAILSTVTASFALAEETPPPEKKAALPGSATAPAKGLVVFVDPVTGKIRQPDPAEIGALTAPKPGTEAAKPGAEPPLVMKYGPGGAVGIVLDGRYESFMVVTKKPDGKLAMDCVTGGLSADAAVAAGAPPTGKKDGKEAPRVP